MKSCEQSKNIAPQRLVRTATDPAFRRLSAKLARLQSTTMDKATVPSDVANVCRALTAARDAALRLLEGDWEEQDSFAARLAGTVSIGHFSAPGSRAASPAAMSMLSFANLGKVTGLLCTDSVAPDLDIMRAAMHLDARQGNLDGRVTKHAARFIQSSRAYLADYEGRIDERLGIPGTGDGRYPDGRRPAGSPGAPGDPGVPGDPLPGRPGRQPITPPGGGPSGIVDQPEPPPMGDLCIELGDLCIELYRDFALAALADGDATLLGSVSPACICHDAYDGSTVFTAYPSAGRSFPAQRGEFRLILRGNDITDRIIQWGASEITFTIPENSSTGFVYLQRFVNSAASGLGGTLANLCGFGGLDTGLGRISPNAGALLTIVRPPVIDAFRIETAGPGEAIETEACTALTASWRVRLEDTRPEWPLAPCAGIEVEILDRSGSILHSSTDAIGDWSFNPSDDDMYRLRVRSVSQDRSCGEVESAPVTVARRSVLRVVPHEPDSAEIVAGRGGSVEVSVSCPAPPAGIEVALSSSDRTLLRLPATATILPGERRVIVALTTDEDGAGEVRITADAPDGTQARLNYQVLANLTAIVLSGGGAKGSFEIGALLYLREIWNEIEPRIICGTSVGAINALALAEVTHSGSVDKMERLWLSLEFNSDMYVESPPVAQASAILGVQISDVILHDAELGSPLNIYGNLVGLTPEAAAWAGAGLAIGGTAGAIVGGIVQIFVDEPADRIADAVSALKNASNFLDLSPTRALIAANVNERSIANSGMQLRLAMVALEDGGLYYATEDGRLIRGHARSSSFREAIVTPQPLVTSAMASSAIPAVFQATRVTTNGLSMHFVDGGVREVLPQQAAVELGAQLIFAISAAPFAPHPAPADPNQSFGDPGRLGAIALRGVDLCVNEVSSEEKAPRAGFCDGRVRVLIQPDIEVHGTTQIDPGLIRINMAYGYFRAFDADRLRRGEIDAFQYLLWGLWAQDLSEQRVFCHRREIIQHMIRARETGFFNHDELQLIRERKNRIAELIIERFDAFGEDGFPRVMRNGTMGDQSALDWCATWELHQNPQRSFLAGVDLWAAQIVAPGVAAEDGGRSSPPVRESNVLSRFPLPQRARDGLRNR